MKQTQQLQYKKTETNTTIQQIENKRTRNWSVKIFYLYLQNKATNNKNGLLYPTMQEDTHGL